MPRAKKHGGARESAPGTAHSNRTDMNSALPVQTAPADGRDFGAVAADEQAQQAVPMGGPPGQPMASIPDTGPGPMPGELGSMAGRSMRPNEPITTGISRGPGAGPEILSTTPTGNRSALLDAAMKTNDPFLMKLASKNNFTSRNI